MDSTFFRSPNNTTLFHVVTMLSYVVQSSKFNILHFSDTSVSTFMDNSSELPYSIIFNLIVLVWPLKWVTLNEGVLRIVSKSKSSPKFIGPYEVIEKIHIFLFLRLDELRGRNLVLRGVECDRISRVFTHFLLNDINLLQIYMLLISCMSQFVWWLHAFDWLLESICVIINTQNEICMTI